MARQETPMPVSKETPVNELVIAQDISAANQLALITRETNERVTSLAQQLGYLGSTDLGALENSARDASEYLGKSIYALGSCLLLLKEGAPHGHFLPTLERLGISADSAQRYMTMSRRFANTATSRHLEKLGFSKMTELLPLDDGQLVELTGLGQTGELSLDDVATMSVRELRAAVRNIRQEKNAVEKVLDMKNKQIDKLQLVQSLSPDEQLPELQKVTTNMMHETLGQIRGKLRQAFLALNDHPTGGTSSSVFMAGVLGQIQREMNLLREEYQLPDVSSAEEQEVIAAAAIWAAPKKVQA